MILGKKLSSPAFFFGPVCGSSKKKKKKRGKKQPWVAYSWRAVPGGPLSSQDQ